jgi:hypothetical protein
LPPSGIESLKLPLKSVIVPVVVPFTVTVTPGIGSLFASITFPFSGREIAASTQVCHSDSSGNHDLTIIDFVIDRVPSKS